MAEQIYTPLMLAVQAFQSPENKLQIGRLIYGPHFCFEISNKRNARMRMDILRFRIQLRHALQYIAHAPMQRNSMQFKRAARYYFMQCDP